MENIPNRLLQPVTQISGFVREFFETCRLVRGRSGFEARARDMVNGTAIRKRHPKSVNDADPIRVEIIEVINYFNNTFSIPACARPSKNNLRDVAEYCYVIALHDGGEKLFVEF